MDLLKFLMELDISKYLVVSCMIKFIIGLDILYVKKVVSQGVLIIIFQKSELIHIILYL